MPKSASGCLRELEIQLTTFGEVASGRKLAWLRSLAVAVLPSADAVLRLHEALCFLRAYPDDRALLQQVEAVLATFDHRADLRRFRRQLQDSGVAGTDIQYEFYLKMAQQLARRWPERLTLDWSEYKTEEQQLKLEKILHLLALYSETPGLDEFAYPVREWIERMKRPDETDAAFLVRRITALPLDNFSLEFFYEDLGLPMRLAPGPDTPSRSRAKAPGRPVVFQNGPLRRGRPDLAVEIDRPPLAIHDVPPREGRRFIELACEAMVTRSRDLDVFANGDPRDVRIVDCGDGLEFVAIGATPERRLMFEAVYGFLALKNGVPVGYVLNSALFGSVEVAYNIFDTFRGGEAADMYGRVLAALKALFGVDAFTIFPYQLGGEGNDEALQSGAWWFYQKLGFRARDPEVLRLMRQELARMRRNPRHRTSIATLAELASVNVYYHHGRQRDDVIGLLPLGNLGLHITRYLARGFGSARQQAGKQCGAEAAARLGLRSLRDLPPGERLAWERWSPLLLLLPGLENWSPAEREGLREVVLAKGGQRESDFAVRFDAHRKLRTALLRLIRREVGP
ncbi:MAG: hypothetical protein ABIF77_04215 [bacterium]